MEEARFVSLGHDPEPMRIGTNIDVYIESFALELNSLFTTDWPSDCLTADGVPNRPVSLTLRSALTHEQDPKWPLKVLHPGQEHSTHLERTNDPADLHLVANNLNTCWRLDEANRKSCGRKKFLVKKNKNCNYCIPAVQYLTVQEVQ